MVCGFLILSVSGVSFLSSNVVVTTSVDQRLSVWWRIRTVSDTAAEVATLDGNQRAMRVHHVYSNTHDIADASSLSLYHWG